MLLVSCNVLPTNSVYVTHKLGHSMSAETIIQSLQWHREIRTKCNNDGYNLKSINVTILCR